MYTSVINNVIGPKNVCPLCEPGEQCDPVTNQCVRGVYCAWEKNVWSLKIHFLNFNCIYVSTVHKKTVTLQSINIYSIGSEVQAQNSSKFLAQDVKIFFSQIRKTLFNFNSLKAFKKIAS